MPIAACRPVMTSRSATPAFTGSPSGLAGHAHEARQRLDDDVVAGATGRLGHLLVEGRQRAGDQAGGALDGDLRGRARARP